MTTLVLSEYTPHSFPLSPPDVEWIRTNLSHKIAIEQVPGQMIFSLNPGPHVGVVKLPSGIRLECRPKVGVGSFFHMLAVIFDLDPDFRDEQASFLEIDDIFEFVIRYFSELVNERISHGLYRAYWEREDNLSTVRGRIASRDDMRLNHILRHKTYCRYSELTWDIPENQIIRQVAHRVLHWVTGHELRSNLRQIDRAMAEVTPTNLTAKSLDRMTYHRLNRDYRPIHQLCRLFLEGSTVSEKSGQFDFRTFLFNMNSVFERYVTKILTAFAPIGCSVEPQVDWHLDASLLVGIRPDLVMTDSLGIRVLTGDCKYKKISEESFRQSDLFQVLGYCTALGLRECVVIYPRHEVPVDLELQVNNSPIRIYQLTIDLQENRIGMQAEAARLANRVWELAHQLAGPGTR